MWKRILAVTLALTAFGLVASSAQAKVLAVGDPAPAITVKKFVKGTPVTHFEKGKLYVVEFWATWCGPCKESIPHLTQLQKRFKDVTFIGVSVSESNPANVEPFVKQMGDKMDYHVAMDDVPAGQSPNNGQMNVHWMQAAAQTGIPTAFVINKESKIAWIGHPMEMEAPLSKIVAGTWDVKSAAAKSQHDQEIQAKVQALNTKITPVMRAKDYAKALVMLNDAIKSDPSIEVAAGPFKFGLLLELKKDSEAADYGTKLVDGIFKDNMQVISALAWNLIDPSRPTKASPGLVNLAVKAATRADVIAQDKNPGVIAILAAAYYAQGKVDKAIELDTHALTLAKAAPAKGAQIEAQINKDLQLFRQAKK